MVTDTSKADLVQDVRDIQEKLEQLEQALRPIIPQEWLSVDLTMPQLKVILTLSKEGPARMSDLAASLGVTLATATGIVDRLVEKGYVIRESFPEDRRVVICRLSEEGGELMNRLWQSGRTQVERILEVMTPEQLRIVAQGTETFIEAARAVQQYSRPQDKAAAK